MSLSKRFSSGLQTGAERLKTLSEKLHVPAPKGLLSIFPAQWNELEHFHLDPTTCRIHIGKMTRENNNLYTTDMMKGLIESLIPYLKSPSDRISIVLRTQMAEYLLDDVSKSMILPINEQIALLHKLIRKHFPKYSSRIDFIDVSTLHPKVFSLLQDNDSQDSITWLDTTACPTLPDTVNSTDILKYLYRCSKKYPKFFDDLQRTKTTQHILLSNQIWAHKSDYYALVEVALRITDYLNGISIHGGMKRQEAFDGIIRNLLFKNTYKDIPELNAFSKRAELHTPSNTPFKALYFDNIKYGTYLTKIAAKNSATRTLLAIILSTTTTLTTVLGITTREDHKNKQKLQAQLDRMIDEALQKADITFFLNQRPTHTNLNISKEQILPLVTYYAQKVYAEYGEGDIPEQELTLMILSDLLTTHPDLNLGDTPRTLQYQDHIKTFFDHHATYLVAKWFSPRPYEQRAPYEDILFNTLVHAVLREDARQYTHYKKWKKRNDSDSDDEGSQTDEETTDTPEANAFHPVENVGNLGKFWTFADIGIVTQKGERIIVGSSHPDDDKGPKVFTEDLWEAVAEDYFYRRYPGIETLANAIFFRYIDSSVSSYEQEDFKLLLRNYIARIGKSQNLLNTPAFINPYEPIDNNLIDTILMEKLEPVFKKFGYTTIPYGRYLSAYKAASNTEHTAPISDLLAITRQQHDIYKVTPLWFYVSAEGILYQLATTTYNNKDYLLARQLPSPPKHTYDSQGFWYISGQEVAKELLETWRTYNISPYKK